MFIFNNYNHRRCEYIGKEYYNYLKQKGSKSLRQFDAKNIAGRAGRFYHHYSGRVIDLNNGFESIVNGQPEVLEHKNYDIKSPKTDIDYQVTQERYLSENDRKKKLLYILK